MSDSRKEFFIGRIFDSKNGKVTEENVFYDPADLTTHGIVTGMTGSGKTGLCIAMLEEAALQKIPAIIIDPKGDLTNLLLHFPELRPQDFQPWLDPESARREGKELDALAKETAENWKNGLASWGLGREDLIALGQAADFEIFTPGSTAGSPVSILSSFALPDLSWEENKELLREKISTTITAVLGLVGMNNIDPLRSKEHILLSNILENAWINGHSLSLTDLIMQTQDPPFDRLGAFPVDNLFPQKERFELAMLLNNFLASPSFQTWLEGVPLDIGNMLFSPAGKPRHNIFYIAHLNESERMFFVTLLFAAVESWMRAQRGTSALRALVYFDEIMGYLPPVANPPSRTIMLRMLKQARAFGVGLLLATQNPVDVDYKALSNAGTWLIGRLQTDQDKQRLLDGLQSAAGNVDRQVYDRLISGLKKRVFLLHNVHNPAPVLLSSRWAMNFLAGPLTREQLRDMKPLQNPLSTAGQSTSQVAAVTGAAASSRVQPLSGPSASPTGRISSAKPAVPAGLTEYFYPPTAPSSAGSKPAAILYRPALLAQSEVRYLNRTLNLDTSRRLAALVTNLNANYITWEDHAWEALDPKSLHGQPLPNAQFSELPGWLADARRVQSYQKDFDEWVYRNSAIRLRSNKALGVNAGPEMAQGEFMKLCSEAARKQADLEIEKVKKTFTARAAALEKKITLQQHEVKEQQQEVDQRRMEELGAGGNLLLGLLTGRRRNINTNLTKRRLTSKSVAQLEGEQKELDLLLKEQAELQAQLAAAIKEIEDRWGDKVMEISETPLAPQKKDIYSDLFGIVWLPYYMNDGQEIPAFAAVQR